MNSAQAHLAYQQSEGQAKIHPVKLIFLMYERTLAHLFQAEEGIREKNPKKRGENLGKAIAIITELNASVKGDDTSESARFLKGLYGAILTELPKTAISDDLEILQRSRRYIQRLKEIWEQTALREINQEASGRKMNFESRDVPGQVFNSSPEDAAVRSVSVSI
ncbi:MAG: flagellar export chaperone FliS [Thermodesulfobacteriota bacterium]|nr:flagellar export chaperone FliS [Thermodesulfobacteriota bacterium]